MFNTILLSINQTTLNDNRREKPAYFINQPNTTNNTSPKENEVDSIAEDESYDAVIVGAGLAGIQAAKT